MNPIWHQDVWCCVAHPIIERSKTVSSTSMEPCFKGMVSSVSSHVAAWNWKDKRKELPVLQIPLSTRAWSLFWLCLDYTLQIHHHPHGTAIIGSSPRLGRFLVVSLTWTPGEQALATPALYTAVKGDHKHAKHTVLASSLVCPAPYPSVNTCRWLMTYRIWDERETQT